MNPYRFQMRGAGHLVSGRRRYLGDEMGLGKTVQAILAVRRLVTPPPRDILVVCPASVQANWHREWRKWYPYPDRIPFETYSYAVLRNRPELLRDPHGLVILDEAHYTKNPEAKRSQYALTLAQRADRAFLLSGTPGSTMYDMWTVFKALWPELLRPEYDTQDKWLRYFCRWTPTKYGVKVFGHKSYRVPEIKHLLGQVVLRRTVDEVLPDLPPLWLTVQHMEYDKAFAEAMADEWGLYQEMVAEDKAEDSSASRLRRLIGTLKAPSIAGILREELTDGQYPKLVVGYYHREVGARFQEELREFSPLMVDGSVPAAQRQGLVDAFNTQPQHRVFLGQMTAAGEGLNLQSASEVVLAEPDWTPRVNQQFIKRIHRIGQERSCRARVFAVSNTMDSAVMERIAQITRATKEMGL